jgi:hypothetical protein
MRIKNTLLLFVMSTLIGCGPKHMLNIDYDSLTQSPCVDGTILNIDKAGCEVFYWGHESDGSVLKMRCTYSPEENFWTSASFYATGYDIEPRSSWLMFCADSNVSLYVDLNGNQ